MIFGPEPDSSQYSVLEEYCPTTFKCKSLSLSSTWFYLLLYAWHLLGTACQSNSIAHLRKPTSPTCPIQPNPIINNNFDVFNLIYSIHTVSLPFIVRVSLGMRDDSVLQALYRESQRITYKNTLRLLYPFYFQLFLELASTPTHFVSPFLAHTGARRHVHRLFGPQITIIEAKPSNLDIIFRIFYIHLCNGYEIKD